MSGKIKVLWFCNVTFSELKSTSSGTWLHAMASALLETGSVDLYNITESRLKRITRHNSININQWLIPRKSNRRNKLPNIEIIKEIQEIVNDISPDIIHIWGTENYWGLLSSRGFIKGNVILEIQGLKFAISNYFFSGLSLFEYVNCIGVKELLKPSISLFGLRSEYKKWGKFEKEMLLTHKSISTQSNWVRAYVKSINPQARLFNTSIAIRSEFLEAMKWELNRCVPFRIFTSANSSSISYKGLHILIDAIAILKKQFPQISLCIACSISEGLRLDGYSKWLISKIKHLGLTENVYWLGSLDADNIISQMYQANVVVIPSFIESYCLALEESLTLGVPTVASFAGGMPELATHEETALFFTPGDIVMCANSIERFFTNKELIQKISCKAYNEKRNKKNADIALTQLSIYKKNIF